MEVLIFLPPALIFGACAFVAITGPDYYKLNKDKGHHPDANKVYEFRDNPEYKKIKETENNGK